LFSQPKHHWFLFSFLFSFKQSLFATVAFRMTFAKIIIGGLAFAATALGSPLAKLSQSQTNGNCELGTLGAKHYPTFRSDTPLVGGYPWGKRTAQGSNPYTDTPNTGVTRQYDFTVSQMELAPDGVKKQMVVANGQFPGPTIEANWGDYIEVTVHNNLASEGTSLHWHGLLQKDTPWFDGTPSVQQCPIAPGQTYTYRFRADMYGTSWWHAHYSAQYSGGLLGPMIIHGPNQLNKTTNYDFDLGPVLLTDYYHSPYETVVKNVITGASFGAIAAATKSDNNLINGKNNYNCSLAAAGTSCTPNAGLSEFQFEKGNKYRLRLINAGADSMQHFSIDGHSLTVIAHDFVPVEPYTVNMVALSIGQRVDVVVTANQDAKSSYYMRSQIQTASDCLSDSFTPNALAIVYYQNANKNNLPTSTPWPDNTIPTCVGAVTSLANSVPVYSIKPANPDLTLELEITFAQNATGDFNFMVNNSTFHADYNSPSLLLAKKGNTTFSGAYNVYNNGDSQNVRVIVKNNSPLPHPMHLHGHNMFILADEAGLSWDGTITNPNNPSRRDTHWVGAQRTMVMQYQANNVGVWPFHCHIAWHNSEGLFVQFMSSPDKIKNLAIPETNYQQCRDWATFTGTTVVDEIDSGT
jgi:FtsP/CotA-like multicopper oxidase with cupredoxin domain